MASPTGRTVLKSAARATPSRVMLLACGAHAARRLPFSEHCVPGANDTMTRLCNERAEKEKVGVTIDFITTQDDKLILTAAAAAQAKSGHDISSILSWHCTRGGEPINKTLDWAASEIERALCGCEPAGAITASK